MIKGSLIFTSGMGLGFAAGAIAGAFIFAVGYVAGEDVAKKKAEAEENNPTQRPNIGDILVSTESEAQGVVSYLKNKINQHGSASVQDLYDAVGVQGIWIDSTRGWVDLEGVLPFQTPSGSWNLGLPEPNTFARPK